MKLKCILAQPIYLNEPRLQVIKESTQGILTPPSKLIFIQVVSKEILITFLNPFYIQLLFISLDVLLWMNPLFLCIYLFLLKESANFILSYALFDGTAGVKDQTVFLLLLIGSAVAGFSLCLVDIGELATADFELIVVAAASGRCDEVCLTFTCVDFADLHFADTLFLVKILVLL